MSLDPLTPLSLVTTSPKGLLEDILLIRAKSRFLALPWVVMGSSRFLQRSNNSTSISVLIFMTANKWLRITIIEHTIISVFNTLTWSRVRSSKLEGWVLRKRVEFPSLRAWHTLIWTPAWSASKQEPLRFVLRAPKYGQMARWICSVMVNTSMNVRSLVVVPPITNTYKGATIIVAECERSAIVGWNTFNFSMKTYSLTSSIKYQLTIPKLRTAYIYS